jgi:tripartite-type tricarboxylate transporter receptor subunit TctC
LVDLAKSEPGKLNFGSTGTGAPPYLMMAILMKDLGIQMTNINYQGTSPTIVALLGGEIQVAWASTETVAEQIKAGAVKALAVSTNQRSPALPSVPTVAEAANLPAYDERVWQGIVVPAGTPREVIDRLHQEVVEILKEPKVVEQFKSRGYFIIGSTPAEFDTFIRSESAKWGDILRDTPPQ